MIFFPIVFFVLLICLSSLCLYLFLFYLSKFLLTNLTYQMKGFFTFADINFCVDNEYFFFSFHADFFQIYLIWLRIRVRFYGLKTNFVIKNDKSILIKTKPINKYEFSESFIITRKKSNKTGFLSQLKEKFYQILKEQYINKHIEHLKDNIIFEEEYIDNLIKKTDISRSDKFIRNLLVCFDFLLENIELNFKLSELDFFHSIYFRKGVFGVIKGLNKHKEIHLMVLVYDFSLKEYVNVNTVKFRKSMGIKSTEDICNKYKTDSFKNPFTPIGHTFDPYAEFSIVNTKKIYLNIKLEYGLYPVGNLSLKNTMNIKCEISNSTVEFSSRCINTFLKLTNEMIKFNQYKDFRTNDERSTLEINNSINSNVKLQIECIEENLLNIISSTIKKIKVKLNDLDLRILSDNHRYIFSCVSISTLNYSTTNSFNYYYDSNKLKLLKSSTELKLNDLLISSSSKEKIILELQSYSFTVKNDLVYYHTTKEANYQTAINSDLPNVNIIMTTKELDKFVEIIVLVVTGLEKVEAYSERSFYQTKYKEDMHIENVMTLIFSNVNFIVHDDVIQGELNNFSLYVRIDETKNKGGKVNIEFSPVYINAFRKYSSRYASNLIVKGFKLNIVDDLKTSHIDVFFEDTMVLFYDDHLIDIMKFVADFLTYNLRYSVKRKYKQKIHKEEFKAYPNRVDTTTLHFGKVTVYYYVDFNDIFTLKINDFTYLIDDYINVPKVLIYHQSTTNSFLKRRSLGLDLNKFYIKFYVERNELDIQFGKVILNVYAFELMHPIVTMFTYYHFFPLWILYHMNYKYRIDEDYKLIYVTEFAKTDLNTISFEEVIVNINQNPIASAAILQTNVEKLKNKNSAMKMLQDAKCEQMQIKVKNFTMKTRVFYERDINRGGSRQGSKKKVQYTSNEGTYGRMTMNSSSGTTSNGFDNYFDENNNEVVIQDTKPYYNKLSKSKFIL